MKQYNEENSFQRKFTNTLMIISAIFMQNLIPMKPGNMTGENTALMIEENLR